MKIFILLLFFASTASPSALAASAYASEESRNIKSMSESDVQDLIAGKGMGYAKAAELNGFPGPAHVLQLADKLHLTSEQKTETQVVFDLMQAAAKTLGAELVRAEHILNTLFLQKKNKF